jgi:hypothetical protein
MPGLDTRVSALLDAVGTADPLVGVPRLMLIEEAIATTAASHPAGHRCIACDAALGDGDAFLACCREAAIDWEAQR